MYNRPVITKFHERRVRLHYFQSINISREEARTVVFQYKAYIHGSRTLPFTWNDQIQPGGYAVPVARGQRLISVHDGSQYGFVPSTLVIFKSN